MNVSGDTSGDSFGDIPAARCRHETTLQFRTISSTGEPRALGKGDRSADGESFGEEAAWPDSRLAISLTEATEFVGISRALAYELVARVSSLRCARVGAS